jgi:glutathione synthase/RimK-type ligase-like ATP-grasp enzyme
MKCTNKVFLHELLARHQILTPRTVVVHRQNRGSVAGRAGLAVRAQAA